MCLTTLSPYLFLSSLSLYPNPLKYSLFEVFNSQLYYQNPILLTEKLKERVRPNAGMGFWSAQGSRQHKEISAASTSGDIDTVRKLAQQHGDMGFHR